MEEELGKEFGPKVKVTNALSFIFLNFLNVYLFLRERERERDRVQSASGGGSERETLNPKWASGSELSAQSPKRAQTHEPQDLDLSRSQMLNH